MRCENKPLLQDDPRFFQDITSTAVEVGLAATPAHTEYPAAHGCVTGAVSTILAGHFGSQKVQFSVDSLVTHTTHTYDSTNDLMKEVEAARIYAGFHYHHSVVEGRELGRKVAHQWMKEFFRRSNEDRE